MGRCGNVSLLSAEATTIILDEPRFIGEANHLKHCFLSLEPGMDAAYAAWNTAIENAGLTWKYRLSEKGEWNISETKQEGVRGVRGWYDVARESGLDRKTLLPKRGAEQEIAQEGSPTLSPLDRPLPWSHIDLGIDVGWLRDELMRALSGTLTPDCAFYDCSSCGVCGDELGHNVALDAPEIPEFKGEFLPSTESVQRIRVAFAKDGALALASHLDTARMLDRLLRRCAIPISFNGGFHPHPRIINAAALPFGATSAGELVDFVLTECMDVEAFRSKVDSELPGGMRAVLATEVPVKSPPVSLQMVSADYELAVVVEDDKPIDWNLVVQRVRDSGPVKVEKVSKRGNKSMRDLRSMVYTVAEASPEQAAPVLEHIGVSQWPDSGVVLSCRLALTNAGALGPDGFVRLLNIVMGFEDSRLQLMHAHRTRINLMNPNVKVNVESEPASELEASRGGDQ